MHAVIASSVAVLCLVYAVVLACGLLTLPSSAHPIQDPWFTAMELLILAIAPAMVGFTVVLHARAADARKAFGAAGVAFMSICAALTCSVHFGIQTLGRAPGFAGAPWSEQVFAFRWPSVVYALDVLAWDFFFALAALCTAATLEGEGRVRSARRLMYASAVLAFVGLAGVPLGDMHVRNVGIAGYAVAFPLAAALLASVYRRRAADPT